MVCKLIQPQSSEPQHQGCAGPAEVQTEEEHWSDVYNGSHVATQLWKTGVICGLEAEVWSGMSWNYLKYKYGFKYIETHVQEVKS